MFLFRALMKIWVTYRQGGCLWLCRLYTAQLLGGTTYVEGMGSQAMQKNWIQFVVNPLKTSEINSLRQYSSLGLEIETPLNLPNCTSVSV